jgi:hypothetical protein
MFRAWHARNSTQPALDTFRKTNMLLTSKPIRIIVIVLAGFITLGAALFPERGVSAQSHPLASSLEGARLLPSPGDRFLSSGEGPGVRQNTAPGNEPAPGQPTTITVVIKNIGTARLVDGFYTYLYIDPPQQPPTITTPDTNYVYWGLGLNPGATFTWSYTDYVFDSAGCNHVVYAWVDRDNEVAEDNEANNLSSASVCVGAEAADVYWTPARP